MEYLLQKNYYMDVSTIISLVLGILNIMLPSNFINEVIFRIDIPEEYGIYSENQDQFDNIYLVNNPMIYKPDEI